LNDYYNNPKPLIEDVTLKSWYKPVKYALERDLAILTFSDNPHEPKNSQHGLHGIGTRFTWIKMDETPSLEGLRQAFLLPQFRIKNDFECSTIPYETPELWIKSIEITNTSLNNGTTPFLIEFNPQLNTIIGGRGSGKSSILRFIRGLFNRITDIESLKEILKDHNEFYKKEEGKPVKGVLRDNTIIEIEFIRDNTRHKLRSKRVADSHQQTIEVETFDLNTNSWFPNEDDGFIDFFKFEQYSQKHIYEIAQEPNALRIIIDKSIDGIEPLKNEQKHIMNLFQSKSLAIRTANALMAGKGKIETRIKDLDLKIKALQQSGIAQLLTTKENFSDERKMIADFRKTIKIKESLVDNLIKDIEVQDINYSGFKEYHSTQLKSYTKIVVDEFNILKEDLLRLKQSIIELDSSFLASLQSSNWKIDLDKNTMEFNEKKLELEEGGIDDISNFEKLTSEKSSLEKDLNILIEKTKNISSDIEEKNQLKVDFLNKTKEITEKRREFINRTFKDSNVKIDIKPFRDRAGFEQTLDTIINPSTYIGDYYHRDIDVLLDILFSNHNVERQINGFRDAFLNLRGGENVENISGHFLNLIGKLNDQQMDMIDLIVPEDEIEVKYKTEGSSIFKSLVSASPGQKTTAILTFLLSYGEIPLILDQPEDDLDNRHVYELIVGRLKKAKERRQIIVVTHNANIPVNGDAEYIISMNSESKYLEILHSGTVEQPNIKKEICDVMEGTEKAFQMRSDRYKLIK
jgi:ABC-type cobalamin/Fe3+-siderophores transport system ATPase subunit